MPWFLYHAFKQLFPTGRWFPFFTFMSGLGIAVGVALMLVSSAIMSGFGHQIRQMIVDSEGEIQVVGSGGTIRDAPAVMKLLNALPVVAASTPTANGPVMIMHGKHPSYPVLRGVDLATVGGVFDLERFMRVGSIENLDDDSVILSEQLAQSIGARLDSEVEISSPLVLEGMLPQKVRVAGIFEIGHPQLDGNVAICTLRRMQDLYGIETSVHRINIRLQPGVNEFAAARVIDAALPKNLQAITWVDAYGNFTAIIRFEKNMIFFLVGFIVIVAALSIMSSLLIAVVRKTREIGLLNALGGRSRDIAASFCLQGLLLGIVGTAAGLAIGGLVIRYRDAIMKIVARVSAGEDAFHEMYGFVKLPVHLETRDLVTIIIGSIICSALAGLIPAWRAARLKPVEALRSE